MLRSSSQVSGNSVQKSWPLQPAALRLCLAAAAFVLPLGSQAQTPPELDRLLFEPEVLASTEPASDARSLLNSSPLVSNLVATSLPGRGPADALAAPAAGASGNPVPPSPVLDPGDTLSGTGEDFPGITNDASDPASTIDRYLQAIADEELDNGPFAPELQQQLLALGQARQQQGDHEEALEAFARAEHISRINNGLHAPDHSVIVERMIESLIATGDISEANTKQQYLLYLQQQYYGQNSMEVVPALTATGDWNMDAFNTIMERPSAFRLNLNAVPISFGRRNVDPRVLAFSNLHTAQWLYYQAIVNIVQHRDFANPLLLDTEKKLIEATFLSAHRQGIIEEPGFYMDSRRSLTGSRISRQGLSAKSLNFESGRNAWMRIRIYLQNVPAINPLEVADAMVGLGDWYMLFNRRPTALRHYSEAWQYLQQANAPPAVIGNLLTPQIPAQLPQFTALPHSRAHLGVEASAEVTYDGYIDVSFAISRFGNVQDLQVLGKSANATRPIERRLKRLLHSAPFRPRLYAGIPAERETVQLRYWFAAMPEY